MNPNYTYMGYRLARILSEALEGDTLIRYTLHWRSDCPTVPSPDPITTQISDPSDRTCGSLVTTPDPQPVDQIREVAGPDTKSGNFQHISSHCRCSATAENRISTR